METFIPIIPSSRTSRTHVKNKIRGDRFIPNRAGMNISQALLFAPTRDKEEESEISSAKKAYRKLLDDAFFEGRTRIFSYSNKPLMPTKLSDSLTDVKYVSRRRRNIPKAPEKILDAPNLIDDYHLNLLDWGSANVLSVALSDSVYLWNATSASASELVNVGPECGPVTSVSWAPDGRQIAFGLPTSHVQIWDCNSGKLIRTLKGIHQHAVAALAWNNNMLSTGSLDCTIVNNDIRVRDHAVSSYCGHGLEVCSLKWSESGKQLASGGKDGRLNIWDLSKGTQLRRFIQRDVAKAIAWCPYQSNRIVSGEAVDDGCVKLWDVDAGTCLKSVETGSPVSGLLWNKEEKELLSSHCNGTQQLTLWKYPSFVKMAEISYDASGVTFMAESPNMCTVASAQSDERIFFWDVFGDPLKKQKPAPKIAPSFGPSNFHIR